MNWFRPVSPRGLMFRARKRYGGLTRTTITQLEAAGLQIWHTPDGMRVLPFDEQPPEGSVLVRPGMAPKDKRSS